MSINKTTGSRAQFVSVVIYQWVKKTYKHIKILIIKHSIIPLNILILNIPRIFIDLLILKQ